MFGSPPPPRPKDLNLPCRSANPSGGKRSEEPVPDVLRHQPQQISSGLLRYRSAPSSLLGEVCSPENETMFTRFLAPDLRQEGQVKTPSENGPQFLPTPPQEVNMQQSTIFHPQHQQMRNRSSIESSIPLDMGSLRMETGQIKRSSSNLIRQSSSPAGLFSHFTVDNGYATMRRTGGFRDKGQLSFSSRQSSIMSQISEMESEDMEGDSDKEEGTSADGDGNGVNFMLARFPVNSWDDSSMFNDSYFSLKEGSVAEVKKMVGGFSSAEHQDGEMRNHASGLLHQLDLPKNSSAMPTIEKFLHFHDAIPCKIRAKRGCATHPRSIAERVRRTRISERIRRLQELVPSMDKQTNTSDMLDLAVDYIKDLQKQVKALSESQANCNCLASRQKPY